MVAEKLARKGIYCWDGNYYAINVTERLGVEDSGGMVRVGAVHYNTLEEVELFRKHYAENQPRVNGLRMAHLKQIRIIGISGCKFLPMTIEYKQHPDTFRLN